MVRDGDSDVGARKPVRDADQPADARRGGGVEFRLTQGEYDDLDDMQRMDLQALSQILEAWSRRVAELEAGVYPHGSAERASSAKR